MAKTKLIIEIEEFLVESENFCNKRISCTYPSICERGKACEAFFSGFCMTNIVDTFSDFVLNDRELLDFNTFKQRVLISNVPLKEKDEFAYFKNFTSFVRRARRSKEVLHWLKANAVLNTLGGVER